MMHMPPAPASQRSSAPHAYWVGARVGAAVGVDVGATDGGAEVDVGVEMVGTAVGLDVQAWLFHGDKQPPRKAR